MRVQTRRPLDLRAAALMTLVCLIWGVQQVAIKVAAADTAPVMQLAIRFAGEALTFTTAAHTVVFL